MSRAAVAGPTGSLGGNEATLNLPEGFYTDTRKEAAVFVCVKLVTMLT